LPFRSRILARPCVHSPAGSGPETDWRKNEPENEFNLPGHFSKLHVRISHFRQGLRFAFAVTTCAHAHCNVHGVDVERPMVPREGHRITLEVLGELAYVAYVLLFTWRPVFRRRVGAVR